MRDRRIGREGEEGSRKGWGIGGRQERREEKGVRKGWGEGE